jgi:[ribosomal protein S5]-alanine N-acetyltransferase
MFYKLSEDYFVRGLAESDLSGPYTSWFEDQEVCKYNSHGVFPRSVDWFRKHIESSNSGNSVVWAICHEMDGHIGNISLQNLSMVNRSAEFSIILGDKRHHGKSIGKRAGKVLLAHGFEKLNLHRIYCGTAATNLAMKSLAKHLGMVEEGRRREQLFLEGQWVDVLEFGLLRNEFRKDSTDK